MHIDKDLQALLAEHDKPLQKLVQVFQAKNQELNLSSFDQFEEVWQKHIVDSVQGAEFINGKRILDVGAGGGFPTLPLAMVLPESRFMAFDSVGKKMMAVQAMADSLNLTNVETLVGRCEECAQQQKWRRKFDVVTARALAKWPTLLELTVAFAKVGGLLVYYLGPSCAEYDLELAKLFHLELVAQKQYELTGGEERHIWVFEKTAPTPKKWPRQNGMPKKTPVEAEDF